ncbi:MAG: redoxin family protein [Bradymonadia bacterium]
MRTLLIIAALLTALPMLAHGAAEVKAGETYVVLINGGANPRSNYLSHLHHIQDMHTILVARGIPADHITVFSSDGERDTLDLAQSRKGVPKGWWLLDDTAPGRVLNPRIELVNTEWAEVKLQPATYGALRGWFRSSPLEAGDTLLIYVTDHGEGNDAHPDNGRIDLWHEEMSVAEFEALLAELPEGVKTVEVMSQCYSGTFGYSIYAPGAEEPPGDTCGFYSTYRDRQAYGCYPGGRGVERVGHAFHFIDALSRHRDLVSAHDEVSRFDDRPDVPVRSSQLYLERLLRAAAEARGQSFEAYVDALLQQAWQDRGRWERHIRHMDAIGNTYGTFSPRTLGELEQHAGKLPDNAKAVRTYAKRWSEALDDLKRDNLAHFLEAQPKWSKKLQPKALKELDDAAQMKLLREVLPALLEFTRGREQVWRRANTLAQKARTARKSWERLELRLAILLRLRTSLVEVAGQIWLSTPGHEAQKAAWQRLTACEQFTPGHLDASIAKADPKAPEPLPPFADELKKIEKVLPSWLGIRFRPLKPAQKEKWKLAGGAVGVMSVFPDSPAQKAGVQVGDVILGPPGAHFEEPRQIREWTMRSPQFTPLKIEARRDGQPITLTFNLGPYPLEWPELPSPPELGESAPKIENLKVVTAPAGGLKPGSSMTLSEGPYMLFYWATWCGPCKRAVPELLDWSKATGVQVVAVTDEEPEIVQKFLGKWDKAFLPLIVSDELRRSFVAHGVSGTPTFIWVEGGKVKHRQVGYNVKKGIKIEGWTWEE